VSAYVTGAVFTSANPALSSSFAATASVAPRYVPLLGNSGITGSVVISGSIIGNTALTVTSILTLTPITFTPSHSPTGSIIMSGSTGTVKPYYFNGTSWISLV